MTMWILKSSEIMSVVLLDKMTTTLQIKPLSKEIEEPMSSVKKTNNKQTCNMEGYWMRQLDDLRLKDEYFQGEGSTHHILEGS